MFTYSVSYFLRILCVISPIYTFHCFIILIYIFTRIFNHIFTSIIILLVYHRKPFILGLHFFTPAHIMKLVEVVMCVSTSVQAAQAVMIVSKKLGKTGVLVRGLKSVFLRWNTFFVLSWWADVKPCPKYHWRIVLNCIDYSFNSLFNLSNLCLHYTDSLASTGSIHNCTFTSNLRYKPSTAQCWFSVYST